jgi:glycosyltransferase involved in cell wall biosynthesis
MTNAKALCLNMIVKNEVANLERCLVSVADHIACWVIGDTGSTDGTQDFIRAFFAARNIPGELHSFPFHNFEQARNAALDCAYYSPLAYDYLLLDDADMELVVEDRNFREKLEAPCYDLLQRAGISYWNPRLLRRDAGARYHGVTHEYLDVPGGGNKPLHGVWYKDHASGSNRVEKFERDIRLLEEGLKNEPNNDRYVFYLAQSCRDGGMLTKAAELYAKRATMGGWDEEAWYARLQEARCLRDLGDEAGFLRQALAAFNQRPHRAEPLYDLARYYRQRGMNDVSVLFSEPGLAIRQPAEGDKLFIEDFVYNTGLKEEYSIAANYLRDPVRKERGFAACNWLALNRTTPPQSRNLARSNLRFYAKPAHEMMPSFAARSVGFTPPDGYHPINPSIARWGDEIVLAQRSVNYVLTADGQYKTADHTPIHTRNFLVRMTPELEVRSAVEILPPTNIPKPVFDSVLGFEDLRLFAWREELWCSGCVRELTPEGWCQQVLARIEETGETTCRLTDWRVLDPVGPRLHEKNWMPLVGSENLRFVYLCDPTVLIDDAARRIAETVPPIAAEHFRGGSQVIEFKGGRLALVHELILSGQSYAERVYHHRFVWFNEAGVLRAVSLPFFFLKHGIEFAAGLAWHPDGKRLLVSFGASDSEAWIASVEAEEISQLLEDANRISWGIPHSDGIADKSIIEHTANEAPSQEKPRTDARDPFPKNEAVAVSELRQTDFESFIKLLRDAQQKEQLDYPNDEVISAYQEASAACPTRAEALHEVARFCRKKRISERGYQFAKQGLAIPHPTDKFAVENWIYDYGLLDEFAVNAFWSERYQDCLEACQRLLREGKLPPDMHERVKKNAQFAAEKIKLQVAPLAPIAKFSANQQLGWIPQTPLAGTELMVAALKDRLGTDLQRIDLSVNDPGQDKADSRPRIVWMHHDVDQRWVQWCKDKELVDSVTRFVFVSYWQRERYLNAFGLPPQRCVVLPHALDINPQMRRWETGPVLRCAYTSTPFRGLSILLDAWERVSPANAELHIWSSMKLYLDDDSPYEHLYARAQSMRGVNYHGLAPNPKLREALRSMHFLIYPCSFAETACLAAIEAMAAGCRLIVPSLGALPETTAGYARIYPSTPNAEEHVKIFSENLAAELATPWSGKPELSLRQQTHCATVYDWPRRLHEWRQLIKQTCQESKRTQHVSSV